MPEFLSSRMSGTLAEVEALVALAETAENREAASEALRPDVELAAPGAASGIGKKPRSSTL